MKPLIFAGSLALVCAGGAVLGYFFAKEKLGREFDARLEEELKFMEYHYQKTEKVGEFSTAAGALASIRPELVPAAQALTNYQGKFDPTKVETPEVVTTKNIFATPKLDVDWELELRNRTEEAPYVLTMDEYMNGELEYQQITLTYFEGDAVLVDERDEVVEETDDLVGDNNLVKFGLQSNDPNVVYVRNHVKELDIEITRHTGRYAEVVLGLDP